MTTSTTFSLLAVLAACGSVQSTQLPDGGASMTPDGAPASGRCDPGKPFGAPTLVAGLNSADDEIGFALTRDELTGFVSQLASDGSVVSATMLVTRRPALGDPFGVPGSGPTRTLNDVYGEEILPFPTRDGLTLYFSRQVATDAPQLLVTTRATAAAAFGAELAVQVAGTPVRGTSPVLSGDDQRLYWIDSDNGLLHSATRQGVADAFATQFNLTTDRVANPVLSADERTLYYSNLEETDVVMATRATPTAAFGPAIAVPGLNSVDNDAPVYLTADGCVLYLKSNRSGSIGGLDLWQAQRPR